GKWTVKVEQLLPETLEVIKESASAPGSAALAAQLKKLVSDVARAANALPPEWKGWAEGLGGRGQELLEREAAGEDATKVQEGLDKLQQELKRILVEARQKKDVVPVTRKKMRKALFKAKSENGNDLSPSAAYNDPDVIARFAEDHWLSKEVTE